MGEHDCWRVTVVKPGKNDGPNLYLRERPPQSSGKRARRRSAGTPDRAEAEEIAAAREEELNRALPGGVSVVDLVDAYIAHLEAGGAVADRTLVNYQCSRQNLSLVLGARAAATFVYPDVAQLREDLFGLNLSASTVRLHLQHLGAAWRHAERQGLAPHAWITPERLRDKRRAGLKTSKRGYRPAEIHLLLREAAGPDEIYLRTMAETGMRIGELCGLDKQDITQDDVGLWWADLSETKTGFPRRVPLFTDTARELLEFHPGDHGPLALGSRGDRLRPRTLYGRLARILDRLELRRNMAEEGKRPNYDLDQHSFRRSFIAAAARAGVPKPVAETITGHDVGGNVHDNYQRGYVGDDLHKAIERIAQWREAQLTRVKSSPSGAGVGYKISMGNGSLPRRCNTNASQGAFSLDLSNPPGFASGLALVLAALFARDPE